MVGVNFCKTIALSFILIASTARADVLFEGYARIFARKKAIGYTVVRYDFDAKSKKFTATTFLKTEIEGTGVTESLKATADEKLRPLAYSYTSIVGTETKIIDAKFAGTKMTANVRAGKKTSSIKNTLKPDTILSTFLVYAMLSSPQGLAVNAKKAPYVYNGIAEEEGQVVNDAKAFVLEETTHAGLKAFKVKNDFKGVFTSYVNERGEVLGTSNDDMSISTELMADPAKATEGFTVNKAVLKALFGEVPEGKNNLLAKTASMKNEPAGKQQGIPQGQGIQIKQDSNVDTSAQPAQTTPKAESK